MSVNNSLVPSVAIGAFGGEASSSEQLLITYKFIINDQLFRRETFLPHKSIFLFWCDFHYFFSCLDKCFPVWTSKRGEGLLIIVKCYKTEKALVVVVVVDCNVRNISRIKMNFAEGNGNEMLKEAECLNALEKFFFMFLPTGGNNF